MKKIIILITVLLSAIMMIGCSVTGDSTSEENMTDVKNINVGRIESDTNEAPNNNTTSDIEFLSALEKYASTDAISETLLRTYKEADAVRPIPILGPYLEETNIVAYMFFKNNSVCSSALLSFDTKGDPVDIELTEFAESDISKYPFIVAHSNESCYSSIKQCLSIDPDFEILGLVFNTLGMQTTLPVGRCKGETTIKYFYNEPMSFNLVEPFESIEEGRIAFAKYLAEREDIKAQLPKFLWETERFFEDGFWSPYSLEYVFDDKEENINKIHLIKYDVDSWISLPLLDEELNEGVLISHLLYYRNKLIGEAVISRDPQNNLVAVYIEVAQKTDDGAYIAMEKSEYQKSIKKARELYPNIEIEGVMFKDGTYIPFGYQDEEIILMTE